MRKALVIGPIVLSIHRRMRTILRRVNPRAKRPGIRRSKIFSRKKIRKVLRQIYMRISFADLLDDTGELA